MSNRHLRAASTSKPRGKAFKPKSQSEIVWPTTATWRRSLPDLAIGLGPFLSILAVYAQVSKVDFINYDDESYVLKKFPGRSHLCSLNPMLGPQRI